MSNKPHIMTIRDELKWNRVPSVDPVKLPQPIMTLRDQLKWDR